MSETPTRKNLGFPRPYPLGLLSQAHNYQVTGCLQVTSSSQSWCLYFRKGKLTYAFHSINVFKRLDRHIKSLNHQFSIDREVYTQMRQIFGYEGDLVWLEDATWMEPPDYQSIRWLMEQKYLNRGQAITLVQNLAQEVLLNLLQVKEGMHKLVDCPLVNESEPICLLELRPLVEYCYQKVRQQMGRNNGNGVYALNNPYYAPSSAPAVQEVEPSISLPSVQQVRTAPAADSAPTEKLGISRSLSDYKVACIDDSPTMLHIMEEFLQEQGLTVITISNPLKALAEVLKDKPDLILLDITMPELDGYELCSLLRKKEAFKEVPIVMVTGSKGLINRAKAKLVKASGYLTKPFTAADLVKVVFKYLR